MAINIAANLIRSRHCHQVENGADTNLPTHTQADMTGKTQNDISHILAMFYNAPFLTQPGRTGNGRNQTKYEMALHGRGVQCDTEMRIYKELRGKMGVFCRVMALVAILSHVLPGVARRLWSHSSFDRSIKGLAVLRITHLDRFLYNGTQYWTYQGARIPYANPNGRLKLRLRLVNVALGWIRNPDVLREGAWVTRNRVDGNASVNSNCGVHGRNWRLPVKLKSSGRKDLQGRISQSLRGLPGPTSSLPRPKQPGSTSLLAVLVTRPSHSHRCGRSRVLRMFDWRLKI